MNHRNAPRTSIARPMRKAGRLSALSEESFPFCHWGLFISPYNEQELLKIMVDQSKNIINTSRPPSLGTMIELQQTPQGNVPNIHSNFHLLCWEYAIYA